MKTFVLLLMSLAVCFFAGAVGSIFTADSLSSWYVLLQKPEWNPPNWLFGPVWTTLYILMGLALFLVAKTKSPQANRAILLFLVHLVFNALWSFLFFGMKSPSFAFISILALLALIIACTRLFFRIHPIAGILLVPYLAWVSFAAVLNYHIWQLNT